MKDISGVNKVNKEQKKDVKPEKHRQTENKEDILEDMKNVFHVQVEDNHRPVMEDQVWVQWRCSQSLTSSPSTSIPTA